jgi:hypothetical protein
LYVAIVFHTPDELVLEIQIAMRKVFADRPEVVSAVLLGEIFEFGAWLDAPGVRLHNAWVSREGVDAPHSFCYNMREDLAAGELENVPRRPSLHPPHHENTVCSVKRWMHSHQVAGRVLVLPRARFALLRSLGPLQKNMATVSMPPERKRELQDLVALLESMSVCWGLDFTLLQTCPSLARTS